MNEPNLIWKKFDVFMRTRLKFIPETFHYPDMRNYPEVERDRVLYEIMDLLVKNEYNCKMREIMQEWREASK